ncbi:hypothetical protein CVD25_08290 [Bacillus canaveralius]|uniref:Uncharacterized protein n=1 Tax=Bacillus canaveralius TaxID=1403243 RepID=A0A2N5GIF2_9BACI|nr:MULTISPECIES: hypothetical protein [Bacillus]PLR80765.1 hypothetical protein CU635_17080 [Bacillus canaveralius]PLR84303.1 hypothetical protein CVD23_12115 [Bacillus sp. V33-4]PLR98357.1 hypothetical protein CVD25_08290 [Bacillus canaveralius]RSK52922.1 hypothetical protein EJA13_09675 [Bacillus canaveralius]
MQPISGQIISGEFDHVHNHFSVQKVKNLSTLSVLNEQQISMLYRYLKLHENEEDGQIVTLYDQIPVMLTQFETKLLLRDLERVQQLYKQC